MIRRVIMSHVENTRVRTPIGVVETLSRFMRTNYGDDAESEAIRHVVAYTQNSQRELADIWLDIVAELQKPRR